MRCESVIHGGTTIVIVGVMVVFPGAVIVDLLPDFVDGNMVMVGERWQSMVVATAIVRVVMVVFSGVVVVALVSGFVDACVVMVVVCERR
jgi:hypothetical protein